MQLTNPLYPLLPAETILIVSLTIPMTEFVDGQNLPSEYEYRRTVDTVESRPCCLGNGFLRDLMFHISQYYNYELEGGGSFGNSEISTNPISLLNPILILILTSIMILIFISVLISIYPMMNCWKESDSPTARTNVWRIYICFQ